MRVDHIACLLIEILNTGKILFLSREAAIEIVKLCFHIICYIVLAVA